MLYFKKLTALVLSCALITFPLENARAHDHHHDDNRDEHRHHNRYNYADDYDPDRAEDDAELVGVGLLLVAAGLVYVGKSIGSAFDHDHADKKAKNTQNIQPEYYHTLPTTNNYLNAPVTDEKPNALG